MIGLSDTCRITGTKFFYIYRSNEDYVAFFYFTFVEPSVATESEQRQQVCQYNKNCIQMRLAYWLALPIDMESKYFMSDFLQNWEIIIRMISGNQPNSIWANIVCALEKKEKKKSSELSY